MCLFEALRPGCTIFQSFWDGFLGLTSTKHWGTSKIIALNAAAIFLSFVYMYNLKQCLSNSNKSELIILPESFKRHTPNFIRCLVLKTYIPVHVYSTSLD